MQKAKISNWQIWYHPIFCKYVLVGKVLDHPRQSEFRAEEQITAALVSINFETKIAITRNTKYELL